MQAYVLFHYHAQYQFIKVNMAVLSTYYRAIIYNYILYNVLLLVNLISKFNFNILWLRVEELIFSSDGNAFQIITMSARCKMI